LNGSGIACARASKETFNGFYFAIAKSPVFNVADDLVIGSCYFINDQCSICIGHNFNDIEFLEKLTVWKTTLLINCNGYVVITGGA
jgi:hypothetical protein